MNKSHTLVGALILKDILSDGNEWIKEQMGVLTRLDKSKHLLVKKSKKHAKKELTAFYF